eukprot:TRINITY_DN6291_c0_g1_i1.p1 TRINITY_DN6291_c0_g1~~TRINITY_DN6291_c0_g1_i1.p1  ORF type:complete len:104 (-),score=11.70 TRINITY_DN6291_c0_g1_i1:66-377(-)
MDQLVWKFLKIYSNLGPVVGFGLVGLFYSHRMDKPYLFQLGIITGSAIAYLLEKNILDTQRYLKAPHHFRVFEQQHSNENYETIHTPYVKQRKQLQLERNEQQ